MAHNYDLENQYIRNIDTDHSVADGATAGMNHDSNGDFTRNNSYSQPVPIDDTSLLHRIRQYIPDAHLFTASQHKSDAYDIRQNVSSESQSQKQVHRRGHKIRRSVASEDVAIESRLEYSTRRVKRKEKNSHHKHLSSENNQKETNKISH